MASGSHEASDHRIRVLTEALEAERKRSASPQEMGVLEPKQVKKQEAERSNARPSATSSLDGD